MTAVLFTCAGQRVDIVTAFAHAGAFTIATDLNPLAPALYHADDRDAPNAYAHAGDQADRDPCHRRAARSDQRSRRSRR